jgi:RecA-family ATPase
MTTAVEGIKQRASERLASAKYAAQPPEVPATPESPHAWVTEVQRWQPSADLLALDKPVEFAVEGLIQAGKVGALVAAGGTGKTTLLLTLGVCIATGRPFLELDVQQGAFALLSSDDTQDDLNGALARVVRAMKLSEPEMKLVRHKLRVHSLQGLAGDKTFAASVGNTVTPTGLERLIVEALRSVTDLRVVALDTLRQFSGGSTNDEQVIKLSIAGANEVARLTGCAVVMSHHTGKNNYRDAVTDMYCGSGSEAIADNCRFVLLLQPSTWSDIESKLRRTGREKGDPLVLQSTRGSLLVQAPPPIFLHRDGYYLDRVAGAPLTRDQVLDERDRAVLRAVRGGAKSKNAIATVVGGKKQSVLDRIDDLEQRGHLLNGSANGSVSRPQYVLTSIGARFLEGSV